MQVLKVDFGEENLGELIDQEFNKYARKYNIRVDYNEVHITDLIVIEEYRSKGVGTELIRRVEQEFTGRNFENINLTTFAFQAPEFYKKMGFEVEHVRKSSDEKLTKYFLIKHINYIRD